MTRLDEIIQSHRAQAGSDNRDFDALLDKALATDTPRGFANALRTPGVAVIAEIKRRSPSAGELNSKLVAAEVARDYESGGASCLSVLTDTDFFGGTTDDLKGAKSAVDIPVLRKDFTVDARDIVDARIMGADAVLLIVAVLSDDELSQFVQLSKQLALTTLVEVHDAREIERALDAGAVVVGVNQRNLRTFEIDPHLAEKLAAELPGDIARVAESGIKSPDDIRRLASAGYDAVLVGTSVVTAGDAQNAVKALVDAGKVG